MILFYLWIGLKISIRGLIRVWDVGKIPPHKYNFVEWEGNYTPRVWGIGCYITPQWKPIALPTSSDYASSLYVLWSKREDKSIV